MYIIHSRYILVYQYCKRAKRRGGGGQVASQYMVLLRCSQPDAVNQSGDNYRIREVLFPQLVTKAPLPLRLGPDNVLSLSLDTRLLFVAGTY
jgi:hypothetical protein